MKKLLCLLVLLALLAPAAALGGLRAAQENPEEYRGLVVRVAGYLAYFTELDRHVQDSIIARTAHGGC